MLTLYSRCCPYPCSVRNTTSSTQYFSDLFCQMVILSSTFYFTLFQKISSLQCNSNHTYMILHPASESLHLVNFLRSTFVYCMPSNTGTNKSIRVPYFTSGTTIEMWMDLVWRPLGEVFAIWTSIVFLKIKAITDFSKNDVDQSLTSSSSLAPS